MNVHEKYMQMALKFAKSADEKTYPNPMVGAVVVKNNKVIAKGFHKKAGLPHAEIEALNNCSQSLRGSAMYVSLEPCDHFGKTPPCTKAIIESGIKKVYIAMKDPNPVASGKGIKRLKKAGIQVQTNILKKRAEELNRKYIKFIKTGLPYITLKLAQSIDGKIAAVDGSSKWITSTSSRIFAKNLRAKYDAVLVGSNTVKNDDPFLLAPGKKGHNVVRIIIDTKLKIPLNSNIIKTRKKSPVIIASTELAPGTKLEKFNKLPEIEVVLSKSSNNRVPLRSFLKKIAKKGMINIFVEGGGQIAGSLLDKKLVDEIIIFIAPKILGGPYSSIKGKGASNIEKALNITHMTVEKMNSDICLRGRIKNI